MREFTKTWVVGLTIVIFTMAVSYGNENEGRATPNGNGIVDVNVSNTGNVHVCYENRIAAQVDIVIENLGTDTLFNLDLGWFLATDQTGITSWNGVLPPGNSHTISLANLDFSASGTYTIRLWANIGVLDVDMTNDTIDVTALVEPPLVLNVLQDTSVCANNTVGLSVPSGFNSYQWSDGQITKDVMAVSSGSYKVTVTNSMGCMAVDSMLLIEYDAPAALLPGDTVLCDSAIFIPIVSDKYLSYTWGMGDTISDITISQEGSYVLNVIDTSGCAYTDTLNVLYAAPPVPTIPTQVFICEGDSTTLSVSSTFSSFAWSTGATGSSISTTVAGVYYVTVTGTAGCFGFDTVQVLINPLPYVAFTDSLMCNLDPMVLDVGWYSSFLWSNGDSVQNPIITSPGQYSVTVTDLNGCENSDTIDVVNKNVYVSLGNDTSICSGDGAFIILDRYDFYLWDNGHNGASQFIGEPGMYSVTVTSEGCSAEDELLVTEIQKPEANFIENVISPSVTFTNLSNVSSDVLWNFGDGVSSMQVSPSHVYLNDGLYYVTMYTTNACGTDSVTRSVGIYPLGLGNVFQNQEYSIYPSFAENLLNLKFGDVNTDNLEFYVYDAVGKLLVQKRESLHGGEHTFQLDVSQFASGTYFVKTLIDDLPLEVKTFIKK